MEMLKPELEYLVVKKKYIIYDYDALLTKYNNTHVSALIGLNKLGTCKQ